MITLFTSLRYATTLQRVLSFSYKFMKFNENLHFDFLGRMPENAPMGLGPVSRTCFPSLFKFSKSMESLL